MICNGATKGLSVYHPTLWNKDGLTLRNCVRPQGLYVKNMTCSDGGGQCHTCYIAHSDGLVYLRKFEQQNSEDGFGVWATSRGSWVIGCWGNKREPWRQKLDANNYETSKVLHPVYSGRLCLRSHVTMFWWLKSHVTMFLRANAVTALLKYYVTAGSAYI